MTPCTCARKCIVPQHYSSKRNIQTKPQKNEKHFPLILTEAWKVQQNFLGKPPILLITTAVAHIIIGLIFNKYQKANKVQL